MPTNSLSDETLQHYQLVAATIFKRKSQKCISNVDSTSPNIMNIVLLLHRHVSVESSPLNGSPTDSSAVSFKILRFFCIQIHLGEKKSKRRSIQKVYRNEIF